MINSLDFAQRLRHIMDHYALNASSFAERIGVQRSGISHILAGRNKPSLDFVLKIIATFTEVDLYWLLIGKGSFPNAPLESASENTQHETVHTPPPQLHSIQKEISFAKIPEEKQTQDIAKVIILYKNGSFDSFEN